MGSGTNQTKGAPQALTKLKTLNLEVGTTETFLLTLKITNEDGTAVDLSGKAVRLNRLSATGAVLDTKTATNVGNSADFNTSHTWPVGNHPYYVELVDGATSDWLFKGTLAVTDGTK